MIIALLVAGASIPVDTAAIDPPAAAQMPPMQTYRPPDPRIQRVMYDPNQVVPIAVARGYAAVIDLGADQQVESVVVGDSTGWEVTASKRGDHVVLKPLVNAAITDMIVITNDRRYVFLIQPAEGGGTSFVVSFAVAGQSLVPLIQMPTAEPLAAQTVNTRYRLRGAKTLLPVAMRGDALRTYISWGKATALPAIFAVENGREAIVNGRMVGSDYVIESTAARYVFRLGKQRAEAIRIRPERSG